MEDKISNLQEMLNETYKRFSENTQEYIRFLKVAAYNYNFNYTNQTLIFAQMPDAFIVSDHAFWHEKHGRYINRGAKSAQICKNVNGKAVISHVFDYRDTNRRDGVEINFWQLNEQNKIPMMNILNEHGYMLNENEEIRAICEPIKAKMKNQDITEEEIYKFVRTSSYLQLLARINPDAYAEQISAYIDMHDLDLLKKLGYSDMKNIGVAIRRYMLGISQELELKNNELLNEQNIQLLLKKDKEKLLEKVREIGRDNFNKGLPRIISASSEMQRFIRIYVTDPANKINTELYNELSSAWYDEWDKMNLNREEAVQETTTEVVEDNITELESETELSTEEIKDIIREYITEKLHDADDYDTEISGIELYGSRIYDIHDVNSDLDVAVEFKGNNLREDSLFDLLNNVEEPLTISGITIDINPIIEERSGSISEFIEAHKDYRKPIEETESNFSLPYDYMVKQIISMGTGTVHGKYRLYDAAIKKEATGVQDILQKEAGKTMFGWSLGDGYHGFLNCSSKGVTFELYNSDETKLFKWSEVTKIVIDAVEAGTYLTKKEKEELPNYYRELAIENGELLQHIDNDEYTLEELGTTGNALATWKKDESSIIRYVEGGVHGEYDNDVIEFLYKEDGQWHLEGTAYPETILQENGAFGTGLFSLSKEQFSYLKEQIKEVHAQLDVSISVQETKETLITTRSANYLAEDRKYVVLSPSHGGAAATKDLPLYVGLASNYDNHGHYDNSDGSLKIYEDKAFLYDLVYRANIKEDVEDIRQYIIEDIKATDEELLSYYNMAQAIKADFSPMERVASYKSGDYVFYEGEDYKITIDGLGIVLEHPQYPLFNKQVTAQMLENAIFADEISNNHLIKNEHVGFNTAKEEQPEQNKENEPKVTKEENISSQKTKRRYLTLEQRNYRALKAYAPEIVSGKYIYMKKESDTFEPLYIEKISETHYAMAHTYIQNGDVMYDPEITFKIDEENEAIIPYSYEQSGIPGPAGFQVNLTERQRKDIGQFMSQWFKNLSRQGHELTFVRGEHNGNEYEVNVKEALGVTSAAYFGLDHNYTVMSVYGDTNLYVGKAENYHAPYYDEKYKDLMTFSNASHLFPFVSASDSLSKDKEGSVYKRLEEKNMLTSDIQKAIQDAMYIRSAIAKEKALEVDGEIENNDIIEGTEPKTINAELNENNRYMVGDAPAESALDTNLDISGEEKENDSLRQYIGTEIELENRKYIIEEIGTERISLRDITFVQKTGFSIFRNESVEWLQYILQEKEQEKTLEVKDEKLNFKLEDTQTLKIGDVVPLFGKFGSETYYKNSMNDEKRCYFTITDIDNKNDYITLENENDFRVIMPAEQVKQHANLPYDIEKINEINKQNESLRNSIQLGDTITLDGFHADIDIKNNIWGLMSVKQHTDKGAVIVSMDAITFERIKSQNLEENRSEQIQEGNNKPEPENKVEQLPKENFTITDDELGFGGAKEKYRNNVEAIKTLKQIESEKRLATKEEQEILSKYVGWGGIANAFNETESSWSNEYRELKELLTEEEYNAAKESVLSAFYTQPAIIRSIYKAIDKWGFSNGNILEPSCGTGNFFGMLPAHMQNSSMYGIELDDLTGRIAKQLYQKNNILIQGYEKAELPDNFFDIAVGNVPFGQFSVADRRYDKNNFLIHDYFFAKTLDKVRSGGIIAFITSKGTMDKANQSVRRYITERAEFMGAIRLPSNAFKQNAGTEAVADIIFLKKRDVNLDIAAIPEEQKVWMDLDVSSIGLPMNRYFVENPSMIMGTIEETTGQYGRQELGVRPFEDKSLEEGLNEAILRIPEYKLNMAERENNEEEAKDIIPARAEVKNNSFTLIDGEVYYRENSIMKKIADVGTDIQRIKGMIAIRDTMHEVIDLQVNNESDAMVEAAQKRLNEVYDNFTAKYGLINSNKNAGVFGDDNSYCLIAALEDLDENKELKSKSLLFTKRTITPTRKIDKAESSQDALAMSMAEKGIVDLEYMEKMSGIPYERIIDDLKGMIYPVPNTTQTINGEEIPVYVMEDEYLSGNVRQKLRDVQKIVEQEPDSIFAGNVQPLIDVQPVDLTASDIVARLGANWIPIEYYTQFIHETMELTGYKRDYIKVTHNKFSNDWSVEGKQMDKFSTNSITVWGTKRRNAYEIFELCMNQQVAEVSDTIEDEDGKKKTKKNFKETTIAQEKQEKWKEAFADWIFKDIDRREHIVKIYNELFNSDRPRQYSGKYLKLENINNEIELRPHQKDAVAHGIYGGNTLYDHCVGAGKTYEMIATAMESKRLGLCNKTIIAVPNHLTMQVGKDFLKMYPSANILVADKKSFEKQNRKKFCSKIATGDWDAVIIGHSQFERIPVSLERQQRTIQKEIDILESALVDAQLEKNNKLQVKILERSKKALQTRLNKLINEDRKDDVIYFEELGVDKMIVDEAHIYKNLEFPTKMSRISGVGGGNSQRAMDMLMKCQYLDEKTNNKGVIFATGTPISNSMSEMFVMMKYLYAQGLKDKGLEFFDTWAATFGEIETKLELKPEGTGYHMKSRFSKYNNLPELLNMFHEFTDVKTMEMINLPVPEVEKIVVKTKSTEYQHEIILSLGDRADAVRDGQVDISVDNMLKITNDGRKLALDQRLIDPTLEDDPNSKVNKCVENVVNIYKETCEYDKNGNYQGGQAQVIFCDLSTPKKEGFNVYDDIKEKLIANGIKEDEIAFIQDAGTGTTADAKKEAMFRKVREGKIRVIMGSTQMMGTGANIQTKLIALHNLDCPWRPGDLEQRDGRIIRQGNDNEKVKVLNYITEGTFDAYMYQLLENKQRFISQIQNGTVGRSCEEREDETTLNYSEIKALATGNPLIMEKVDLENEINKLSMSRKSHIQEQYTLETRVKRTLPNEVERLEKNIFNTEKDILKRNENTDSKLEQQPIIIKGNTYTDWKEANEALLAAVKEKGVHEKATIGQYRGFKIEAYFDTFNGSNKLLINGNMEHAVNCSQLQNINRMDAAINDFDKNLANYKLRLSEVRNELETAKNKLGIPFAREEELKGLIDRLNEVNLLLHKDDNTGMMGAAAEDKDEKIETTMNYHNSEEIAGKQNYRNAEQSKSTPIVKQSFNNTQHSNHNNTRNNDNKER